MVSVFLGWRRKVGVVALLLAGLFLGMWGRAHSQEDLIQIGVGQDRMQSGIGRGSRFHLFRSDLRGPMWVWTVSGHQMSWITGWHSFAATASNDALKNLLSAKSIRWRIDWGFVDLGQTRGTRPVPAERTKSASMLTAPANGGSSLAKDSSAPANGGSSLVKQSSSPAKESSSPAKGGSSPVKESSSPADGGPSTAEGGSSRAEQSSAGGLEVGLTEPVLTWVRIPYFSLITPLTALSAWLLIGKPRGRKLAVG